MAGLEGVRYMLEASEGIPLRVLIMAPSCVPSAPGIETAGASFDREEIAQMLSWPRVVGLAEVMDYPGVLKRAGRMMRLIEATQQVGGLIQGHGPSLRGRRLSAYAGAGITSDHENRRSDEALSKLRAGIYLEVRESSLSRNAAEMAKALLGRGYLPNVTICTDDVTPEDLLRNGHVNHVLRRLVEEGLGPVDVIRFATLNAAARLNRPDLGALAPGRIADIVLLSDLSRFTVQEVYREGKAVARDGKALFSTEETVAEASPMAGTVRLPTHLSAEDFRIEAPELPDGSMVTVRVINWHPEERVKSSWGTVDAMVRDGALQIPKVEPPLNTLAVVDRYAVHGKVTKGLVRGFGLRAGAIASTVSHDCHQLTVVGVEPEDMLIACRRLAELDGGIVLIRDSEILGEIPLPIAGLVSAEPAAQVAEQIAALRQRAPEVGLSPDNSFMAIVGLTLAVSPYAKLSDLGLVDVESQTLVPFIVG